MNQLVENLQHMRQQVLLGEEGFVGPFGMPFGPTENQIRHIDYYALYLGEIDSQLPALLVLAHDKTAEKLLKSMGLEPSSF